MLLVAVDIGNTNVVIGFLDDGHIAGTYRITTKANHTSDEYGLMITQFLRLSGYAPGDVDDVSSRRWCRRSCIRSVPAL